MKRRPPVLDTPVARQRSVSKEERELWHNAVELTDGRVIAEPKIGKSPKIKKAEPTQVRIKKPALHAANAAHPNPSLDSAILGKIRRGTTDIGATLDLHGHTQITAYTALVDFITRMQSLNIRLVLIITGKGDNGKKGTLRKMLPRWLDESPLRERIIAYDSAGSRHGGSGAWYIRIRKHKANER